MTGSGWLNEVEFYLGVKSLDLPTGGGPDLFWRKWIVGSCWRWQLLVKIFNLLFVHLQHHRSLQLHGRTCGTSKEFMLSNTQQCNTLLFLRLLSSSLRFKTILNFRFNLTPIVH